MIVTFDQRGYDTPSAAFRESDYFLRRLIQRIGENCINSELITYVPSLMAPIINQHLPPGLRVRVLITTTGVSIQLMVGDFKACICFEPDEYVNTSIRIYRDVCKASNVFREGRPSLHREYVPDEVSDYVDHIFNYFIERL